jgi:hypothetical protein
MAVAWHMDESGAQIKLEKYIFTCEIHEKSKHHLKQNSLFYKFNLNSLNCFKGWRQI